MNIKCINSKSYVYLTKNKEYEMLWEDDKTVKIKDDNGLLNYYPKNCFIPLIGDNVDHPTHYNKGIETWDYTDSWEMDFLEGNIIKYVTRWKEKGGIQDLNKAMNYLKRLIERESKK